MLFKRKHPRSCSYCSHGTKIDDDLVLCMKRGAVAAGSACRKFAYDPCKRIPSKPKALDFVKYKDEDFLL